MLKQAVAGGFRSGWLRAGRLGPRCLEEAWAVRAAVVERPACLQRPLARPGFAAGRSPFRTWRSRHRANACKVSPVVLLEVTADLAERRRIRSAIRELQRQELEREEEALASKRFRAERQDNKENWLHYLPLCRGSGYPILASTLSPHPPGLGRGHGGDRSWCPRSFQQREAEQRAALARLAGRLESMNDVEELTALLRGAAEYEERKLIRAAIRRVRAQEIEAATLAGRLYSGRPNSGSREDGQGQAARRLELREVPKPEEQKQQVEVPEPTPTPSSTSRDVTTVTLLLRAPPGDTPSPPASADSSPTTTSPEPPLEPAEEAPCPAPEALGSPEPSPSPPRASSPEPQEPPATPSTDRQVVDKLPPSPTDPPAPQGPTKGRSDTKRAEPTPIASGPSPFQRAGSVRDRVRKFTSDSPTAAGLQEGPPRVALGPSTPARLPGPSHTSTTPAAASSSSGPSSRGTARPLAQLQSCPREEGPRGRGLAVRSLENRAGGPVARSEEPSAPLPVAVGTAEPGASMKTTFTIEIKDGRGQASTGRVLLPTGNQRAELTLGLRAPPALLSTSSGGKSTFTHISSPGNLARLGSVTHVTSFSPASLGSRGGCSIKQPQGPCSDPGLELRCRAAHLLIQDQPGPLGDWRLAIAICVSISREGRLGQSTNGGTGRGVPVSVPLQKQREADGAPGTHLLKAVVGSEHRGGRRTFISGTRHSPQQAARSPAPYLLEAF
ncbi:hypothetical protein K5549_007061 [Capra hircus]|nr:hypothetical protein K5549_007061 [Capra hircus]